VIGTHHTFFDHYLKHVHLDFSWARAFSWQTTVRYYNHCNLIICPSMAIARELKQNGLTKPVQQLSNPVDTDFFFPASQQKASLVSKKPSLIYVGRLSYEKSLDQVLQAFAAVAKAIPGATLKVVGSGPEQQPLEQIVKAAGLAKSVHFLGALNSKEVAAVLRENDIFITASKTENMPLSVIEAMATGLPIVAVAEKGLTELVTNGKNGILVPADSPAKMAHEIIMLLRNPTQLKEFSSRSRRLALQYSPSRIVGDLEKIYTKVLRQSA
jgi:glycosyltransferase involved in cell wall biosynthesis